MRLISLSTILERKEYMPNMKNMPKHHGVGSPGARDQMQLHRLHLFGRFCCGFVKSSLKFITLFDCYQSHTFRIFTAVLYLVTFCSILCRFNSIFWVVKYCHLPAFSFFTSMFFVAHCHPFPTWRGSRFCIFVFVRLTAHCLFFYINKVLVACGYSEYTFRITNCRFLRAIIFRTWGLVCINSSFVSREFVCVRSTAFKIWPRFCIPFENFTIGVDTTLLVSRVLYR